MRANQKGREAFEKGVYLVGYVRRELLLGTEHRNRAGRLLSTSGEILSCLKEEGSVACKVVPGRESRFQQYLDAFR